MLDDEEANTPENIRDTLKFVSDMNKFVADGRMIASNADSVPKEDVVTYLKSALDLMELIFGATQMMGETMAMSAQIDPDDH